MNACLNIHISPFSTFRVFVGVQTSTVERKIYTESEKYDIDMSLQLIDKVSARDLFNNA